MSQILQRKRGLKLPSWFRKKRSRPSPNTEGYTKLAQRANRNTELFVKDKALGDDDRTASVEMMETEETELPVQKPWVIRRAVGRHRTEDGDPLLSDDEEELARPCRKCGREVGEMTNALCAPCEQRRQVKAERRRKRKLQRKRISKRVRRGLVVTWKSFKAACLLYVGVPPAPAASLVNRGIDLASMRTYTLG